MAYTKLKGWFEDSFASFYHQFVAGCCGLYLVVSLPLVCSQIGLWEVGGPWVCDTGAKAVWSWIGSLIAVA